MAKKIVIIGGGAGGASVAAEAKRRDTSLDITMIAREEYVSLAV